MKEEHDRVMANIIANLRHNGHYMKLSDLADVSHDLARAKGFWDDCFVEVPLPDDADKPTTFEFDGSLRNVGEAIALMHSELSEALEAHRTGAMDDKFPQHPGIFVELADCIIRILDFCAGQQVDLQPIILQKMIYNASRPYKHGKAY